MQGTDGTTSVVFQFRGPHAEDPVIATAVAGRTRLEILNIYVDPERKVFKSSDVG